MSALSGLHESKGYEVCDDESQELTWVERQDTKAKFKERRDNRWN
jgi:hypothetical protein